MGFSRHVIIFIPLAFDDSRMCGTGGIKTRGGARVRRTKGFTGVDWKKNRKKIKKRSRKSEDCERAKKRSRRVINFHPRIRRQTNVRYGGHKNTGRRRGAPRERDSRELIRKKSRKKIKEKRRV